MEQTRDNEERKCPEVEGGIRRRLRDRDLLKKRKAEAEEKANQWVYGAESRKKERREERSSTGKKGRPRKINPPTEVQVPQEKTPRMNVIPASEGETELLPTIQAGPPEFVELPLAQEPAPGPDLLPALVPVPSPAPLVVSAAAVPVPATASSSAVTSTGSAEKVLIEDLGPDEEEDLPLAQGGQITGEGTDEELPADVPEQDKKFSYPLFASSPLQHEYFPGNFI
ncbi:hypothetical protein ACEWY4_007482 [Coilia grayii]|uniref:Hemogen n=1 Tax=Coilia grayii TaxID=363190 RepID=A0ABD1KGD2_9TELE